MREPDPKDLRELYAADLDEWQEIRDEAAEDMRYVKGDPWKPSERQLREDANRPVLAFDEIGQYENQIINDLRANPRGMKFSPEGRGATDESAAFYEDKAREIEARSKASRHYITAFKNMIERSYGHIRLSTRYVHSEFFRADVPPDLSLFDQDIWIEGFENPDMVVPQPLGSYAPLAGPRRCWVLQWISESDFRREYPDAKIQSFTAEHLKQAGGWVSNQVRRDGKGRDGKWQWAATGRKQIQIAEYWDKSKIGTRTLLVLKPRPASPENPQPQPWAAFADDFEPDEKPDADEILRTRDLDIFEVNQYLTNGFEILGTKKWPGKSIPITSCYGKMLWIDEGSGAQLHILSMTRLARDPLMFYAYCATQQAEVLGMLPKAPLMGYKGQFAETKYDIQRSVHEPVAYLEVAGYLEGMNPALQPPLPLPIRVPYEPGVHLQAIELVKEGARRAIQAAMGINPLPTDAQRVNDKSGVALKQIRSSGQVGAYHFVDSYDDMIEQNAVKAEDLIENIYDATGRPTAIRKWNGVSETPRINLPNDPKSPSSVGDHLVTVSSGPSFESQRDEAKDIALTLIENPVFGPRVADIAVKLASTGPYIEEIAERLTPPEFRALKNTQSPQALMQELASAKQTAQQMQGDLQKAMQIIQTDQIKLKGQVAIEQMKEQHEIFITKMENAAKIAVAKIAAVKDLAIAATESHDEAVALGEKEAHEARMAITAQAHTSHEAAQSRLHEINQAVLEHQHAIDQATQEHKQGLETAAAMVAAGANEDSNQPAGANA